jgi:tartrate dehydrogenase/decarboxylase / D-malate dehydrogenase
MMLDFLEENFAAWMILDAVQKMTGEGRVLPRDLGGIAGTPQVSDAIVAALLKT